MVAPRILILYSSVWEPILHSEGLTGHDLHEFNRRLTQLRKALTCCVCGQLLTNRDVLASSTCREHFVCSACHGGDRNDNQKCGRCDNWNVFQHDEVLNTIIRSYQQFCHYILTREHVIRLLEVTHDVDPTFDSFKLIDLLQEGLRGLKISRPKRPVKEPLAVTSTVVPWSSTPARKSRAKTIQVSSTTNSFPLSRPSEIPTVRKQVNYHYHHHSHSGDKVTTSAEFQPFKSKMQSSSSRQESARGSSPTKSAASTSTHSYSFDVSDTERQTKKFKPETTSIVFLSDSSRGTTPSQSPSSSTCGSPTKPPATSNTSNAHLLYNTSKIVVVESPSKLGTGLPSASSIPHTIQLFTPPQTGKGPLPISVPQNILSMVRSNAPQVLHFAQPGGGVKTVQISSQPIRLATTSMNMPQGRIPVQVFQTNPTSSSNPVSTSKQRSSGVGGTSAAETVSSTSTPAVQKRRVYVPTTMSQIDLKRGTWPDPSKILQFQTDELSLLSRLNPVRSNLVNVSVCRPTVGSSTVSATGTMDNTRNIATSLVRPAGSVISITSQHPRQSGPSIVQTSSGIASGVGVGAQAANSMPVIRTVLNATTSTPSTNLTQAIIHSGNDAFLGQGSNIGTVIIGGKRKEGCKCGSATQNPGKLTCIGQRCVCYADHMPCYDCKCKGCKNPYLPGAGGKKILHTVRTLQDPHQSLPIMTAPVSLGPGHPNTTMFAGNQIAGSQTLPSTVGASSSTFSAVQGAGPNIPPTSSIRVIPVRIGPTGQTQYIQISGGNQPLPFVLSQTGTQLHAPNSGGLSFQNLPMTMPPGIPVAHLHRTNLSQTHMNIEDKNLPENQTQ